MSGRIQSALDLVNLAGFGDRRPHQLSGGQQQRVALARAIIFEPSLILMDEPLGALDTQLREQLQLEIKHLHRELGVTVVYVTHDLGEALTMSGRIAVFNDGAVEQIASPTELYERPENAFVARLVGENNRLSGRVRVIDGNRICVVTLESGEEVRALPVNIDGPASETVSSLRPEQFEINPPPGALPNQLDAPSRGADLSRRPRSRARFDL